METWIVTGASRGLGRALCLALLECNHRVIACARDGAALQALAANAGPNLSALPLDLSRPEQVVPALRDAAESCEVLGGLINNAGIGWYKPFLQHSEAELLTLVQVNLVAAMQACHAVLPRMLAQGRGQIVNIASDLARRPLANMAPYVASKHGLAGFSQSLLREVKSQGVRVSLVNPGMIDTGFGGDSTDAGQRDPHRHLQVDQLAGLIVQLITQPGSQLIDELSVHPLGQDDF